MTSLYLWLLLGIPILWLAVRSTPNARVRSLLLLIASYGFYLVIGRQFFIVLLASSLFNFLWGNVLRRKPAAGNLWIGIAINVALLSTFKYLPGFVSPFATGHGTLAWIAALPLPVGISFWTFQGLSYLFDQYRGEELDPTLVEFLLYMGFAPTVLSGPIVRLPELLPQLRNHGKASWENVKRGAQSVWAGVLMITLARYLGSGPTGHGVNWAFDKVAHDLSFTDAWLVLIAYGFQLFFDFAGFSRVVIGLADVFGITLPENFRRPFLASTPSLFWTRWHMTLSFWIRDYLFMPMAMMRREVWWRNAMLVFSMVVFGLWHKASWLFIVWGTYQGLLLLFHRLGQQWSKRRGIKMEGAASSAISWTVTFLLITIGWIFFRAPDWQQAGAFFASALTPWRGTHSVLPSSFILFTLGVIALYFIVASMDEKRDDGRSILQRMPIELRYVCYAGIVYFTLFHSAEPQSFIYFQF